MSTDVHIESKQSWNNTKNLYIHGGASHSTVSVLMHIHTGKSVEGEEEGEGREERMILIACCMSLWPYFKQRQGNVELLHQRYKFIISSL